MQVLSKSQKKRMKKKASAAKAAAEQDDSGEENEVTNGNKTAADHEGEEAAEEGDGGEGGDAKKKKKKKKKGLKQTEPPTVPLAKFFPNGRYPEGEWQSYNDRYDATRAFLKRLRRHFQATSCTWQPHVEDLLCTVQLGCSLSHCVACDVLINGHDAHHIPH